jgi:hypothetical protein
VELLKAYTGPREALDQIDSFALKMVEIPRLTQVPPATRSLSTHHHFVM